MGAHTTSHSLQNARRIVVKIGSSSLTRDDGGLDLNRIDVVARLAATWRERGGELLIVSSGAVAAGIGPLGLNARPKDLATKQACAAMGQSLLMAQWSAAFQSHHLHVAQVLLTTDDVMRRDHYTNVRQSLERLLSLGAVPIINENDTVATRELRFGDNDRLAAYVGQIVAADAVVLLTDVDGLYTAPPSEPGARLIRQVDDLNELEGIIVKGSGSSVGTGGMVTKLQAASMATEAGIGVLLTSAANLGVALAGEEVGTWFTPSAQRPTSRTLWIAHAAPSAGELHVDEGAVRALVLGKKSLLAAGVESCRGDFVSGDVVEIVGPNGLVARGIVSVDADVAQQMFGLSHDDLSDMGWSNPRPLVHRDDLAIVNEH